MTGGFVTGAIVGGVGAGLEEIGRNIGNAVAFKDVTVSEALGNIGLGILTGAVIGGVFEGLKALKNRRRFWNGTRRTSFDIDLEKFNKSASVLGGEDGIEELTKSQQRAVKSLEKQISEHQVKLDAYRADPYKFDNKGILKNAPNDQIRQSIIQGRIRHLQHEINTFKSNILKILNGG